MTFTQQLYEQVRIAIPGTTTRNFSWLCGKSEGYYSSLKTQKLPISTNSLIYMTEMIQQIIGPRTPQNKANKLHHVQTMIVDEIARRTNDFEIGNVLVRQMILSAVARAAFTRDHYYLPPIIIG